VVDIDFVNTSVPGGCYENAPEEPGPTSGERLRSGLPTLRSACPVLARRRRRLRPTHSRPRLRRTRTPGCVKSQNLEADGDEVAIPDEPLVAKLRPSLATRRAGASASQKAAELRAQDPLRTRLARVLRVHTDERAWRVGGKGEELVGRQLASLPSPPWYVFHDIPIGSRGANVDHLVIGPGGVFSINTKHLTGEVWITERTFRHNGYRTDYLPKAHREGERVSAILGVPVRPVIAVICDEFTVRVAPPDVDVVSRRRIRQWLEDRPTIQSPQDAFATACRADDPATWRGLA
jgi:hypothetical protein